MLINALSACLLSHVVSNDIKQWACKQLVSLLNLFLNIFKLTHQNLLNFFIIILYFYMCRIKVIKTFPINHFKILFKLNCVLVIKMKVIIYDLILI